MQGDIVTSAEFVEGGDASVCKAVYVEDEGAPILLESLDDLARSSAASYVHLLMHTSTLEATSAVPCHSQVGAEFLRKAAVDPAISQPLFAHIVDGVLQCAADQEEGKREGSDPQPTLPAQVWSHAVSL